MRVSEIIKDGEICTQVDGIQHFDLRQIAESGQCFRMNELKPDIGARSSWSVCWSGWHVRVDELVRSESFLFYCTPTEFKERWYEYFCLDCDWFPYVESIVNETDDSFLKAALQYGSGIRILKQGIWEALLWFLISQNNNISRIKKTVELMCERFGELQTDRGVSYHTVPTLSSLAGADFSGLGLGYREAYFNELFATERIPDTALWIIKSMDTDYKTAFRQLTLVKGIGPKVADCICLYGLHQFDAYPVDTWMRKMIDTVYEGSFDVERYQKCAGYVQQIQFYYFRTAYGSKIQPKIRR